MIKTVLLKLICKYLQKNNLNKFFIKVLTKQKFDI